MSDELLSLSASLGRGIGCFRFVLSPLALEP